MKHWKPMKNWRRNAVVATVLLFVCAGIYLNWAYNQRELLQELPEALDASQILDDATLVIGEVELEPAQAASEQVDPAASDYFAAVRLSRQESRDEAVSTLQESIAYEDQESIRTMYAQTLDSIVNTALDEAQIESLVIAKGFADCVTYIADDVVSVAVSAPAEGLDAAAVALIADVVTSQTDFGLANVRVIEVK